MLGDKIGFDFELFEVPDRKWGAFDKVRGRRMYIQFTGRPFDVLNGPLLA
jgi:hypothetical protein